MIFNFIGNYTLILSIILSFFTIFISINLKKNKKNFTKLNLNQIIFFKFFFVFISFFSLVFLFVNSEFSNETVFNNSHTTKPLFYKISGTWGNHEGSLLLWIVILTLTLFAYNLFYRN